MAYEEGYYDETCGKIKKGKNLSANIKGYSVDVNKVIKYGGDILMPAGFLKELSGNMIMVMLYFIGSM